jgi:hypothetical protein
MRAKLTALLDRFLTCLAGSADLDDTTDIGPVF